MSIAAGFMEKCFGPNVNKTLEEWGLLAKDENRFRSLELNALKTTVSLASHEATACMKTCLKVAFVSAWLTTLAPFVFGAFFSLMMLGALTIGMGAVEVTAIVDQLSKLDVNNKEALDAFNKLKEPAERIAWSVSTTMLLRWVPTSTWGAMGTRLGWIAEPAK